MQKLFACQGTCISRVPSFPFLLVNKLRRHHWITPWHRHIKSELEVGVFAVLSKKVNKVEIAIRIELSEVEQVPQCLLLPIFIVRLSTILKLFV